MGSLAQTGLARNDNRIGQGGFMAGSIQTIKVYNQTIDDLFDHLLDLTDEHDFLHMQWEEVRVQRWFKFKRVTHMQGRTALREVKAFLRCK